MYAMEALTLKMKQIELLAQCRRTIFQIAAVSSSMFSENSQVYLNVYGCNANLDHSHPVWNDLDCYLASIRMAVHNAKLLIYRRIYTPVKYV
jgi:hypothetical protein